MTGFVRRLLARIRNRRFEAELAEELRFHEEMKRRELEAAGATAADARAQARRLLGNVTLAREDARGVWLAPRLESVVQDARYAVRMLARQPLHALTAVSVLVLAIGLNTSLFTVVKATMLAQWPGREPDRLVRLRAYSGNRVIAPSVDEYRLLREEARAFSGVAAYLYGGGTRFRVPGRAALDNGPQSYFVSANFFDVLGARLHFGTGFVADDDLPGGRRSPVILSYVLWRNVFAADAGVIGQSVSINGRMFTVIGVLEERVDGLAHPVDVWLPLSALASIGPVTPVTLESPGSANCCIDVIGRLADGVDVSRARLEVQIVHERFARASERRSGVVDVFGTAYASQPHAGDLDEVVAIWSALLLVLLLACANVGNLQLARGLARRRELATRIAIGAGRFRVVRQLLVEGLVLSAVAGALSVGVAAVLPRAAYRLQGAEIPPTRAWLFAPDWRVIAFTAAVCVVATVVFALAPALRATRGTIPLGALDRGSTRGGRFPLRGALLAVQIAVCTILLAGAGLLTRSIAHALSFDPGFRVDGISRVSASLPPETPDDQRLAFARRLLSELDGSGPGLVAISSPGPMTTAAHGSIFTMNVSLPDEGPMDSRTVLRRSVSRRYFDVLGIPLATGRTFMPGAIDELIVNEAFARTYWRGEDPTGATVREINQRGAVSRTYTIVGIARDAYLNGFERIEPMVFRPAATGALVVRGGPAAVERIRATALALNTAARVQASPLARDLDQQLEGSRFGAAVAWAIGLLGLVLASIGMFGVFAYAVEERRREIGVRLALSAARRQIVQVLITTSGRAMAAGLVAGLAASLACGPVLRSYLHGLSPLDPGAYALVCVILLTAGIAATFIPARRAWRVDPAVTLRED